MFFNLIKKELMKRYLYLYNNKKLILALCINYGIREKYYKKQIKEKNEINKYMLEQRGVIYPFLSTEEEEQALKEPKPYLFKTVSSDIVDSYEEFLFTDKKMEDTILYKYIEGLKEDQIALEKVQENIYKLEERRQEEPKLDKNDAFTVWKILTYIKNKNKNNYVAFMALEKYYNIDRYMLTGENWKSGYKLLQKEETLENRLKFPSGYSSNEFEEEDKYNVDEWSIEFEENYYRFFPKSKFMLALAMMPMLSENNKKEIYQKAINTNKSKILKM